jgi:hypothetical protein
MTNGFFDSTKWTRFIRNTRVRADPINAVFDAIVVAFDLIPPLSTLTSAAASLAAVAGAVAQWAVAAGTADAITAAFPTTVASLTDGLVLGFRATAANATTTPTFKADATTAHTITKKGGAALLAGDIPGANAECIVRYNLANTRWELLNPAPRVTFSDSDLRIQDNGDATKQVAFEVSGVTTGTTRTITVPDANITLARSDAAQTFTGTQTFSGTVDGVSGAKFDTITPHTGGGRVSISSGVAAAAVIADFKGNDTTFAASICDMDAGGANNAGTAFQIQKVNSTGRSMSAAGTINASGADYAEYETKGTKCGDIAKGQIVGFDADGKLTDKFSAAISFAIKSTDPSYVGGDVWGNEDALGIGKPQHPGGKPEQVKGEKDSDFAKRAAAYAAASNDFDAKMAVLNAALEVARVKVDRIAYSGKVPVNILGAKVGDYIIAVQDGAGIGGKAVTVPSFDEYRAAVGRVRRIQADGRAVVAVIIH